MIDKIKNSIIQYLETRYIILYYINIIHEETKAQSIELWVLSKILK